MTPTNHMATDALAARSRAIEIAGPTASSQARTAHTYRALSQSALAAREKASKLNRTMVSTFGISDFGLVPASWHAAQLVS